MFLPFLGKVGFWHPVILASLYCKCSGSMLGEIPTTWGQGKHVSAVVAQTLQIRERRAHLSTVYTLTARWLVKVPRPPGNTAWFQTATPSAEEMEVLEKVFILKTFPPGEHDSGGK